ncbi:hypothetical protein TI05_00855 [Achromatium sp. WMS3]|nr:hypothetical protein TI05_00855 [Achromatium sp. WMS3]
MIQFGDVLTMRIKLLLVLSISFLCLSTVTYAGGQNHKGYLSYLHGPDTRHCLFFTMKNVSQADPVVKNNPWFALSMQHFAYATISSFLLAAYLSNEQIVVATTGKMACGNAEVLKVDLTRD